MFSVKKRDWIEIVLHIAFWIGVFYTLMSLTVSHIKVRIDQNGSILEKDVTHTLSPYIFITLGFLILLFYANIFWLFKKVLRYRSTIVRIILPVAWFCAMFLANQYLNIFVSAQYNRDPVMHTLFDQRTDALPPAKNLKHDSKVVKGDPTVLRDDLVFEQNRAFVFAGNGLSNTALFIFVIVFGLSIAYFFLKEWAKTEKIRLQLQAVQLNTEVKFLKSQINPHFLFNTLNNLFSMAQAKGNEDLADGISKLSGMMRYMIYESNEDNVPLTKEIEYLQNFIVLNKLRYADDEVAVIFDYPDKTEGIFIAPMIFIPFVENAFKHGVLINQSSQIDIAISIPAKNQVLFTCENQDYGFVKKMDDNKSGIGLENVKRRLELLYPGNYELAINSNAGKYMVMLKINLHLQ